MFRRKRVNDVHGATSIRRRVSSASWQCSDAGAAPAPTLASIVLKRHAFQLWLTSNFIDHEIRRRFAANRLENSIYCGCRHESEDDGIMEYLDAAILIGISALIMGVGAKVYERRQDVLYGRYIHNIDQCDLG